MVDVGPALRWGIERRMAFLDACLFWSGQVNRGELVKRFKISVPQASADLARYRDLAPGNMHYDASLKTYVRGCAFEALYELPTVDGVLDALASAASGNDVSTRQPWIGGVEAAQVIPAMHRNVRADILQRLLAAVRDRRAVEIEYQSLSRPDPTRRWIEPHALASDGDRWHARAFCAEHRDFRDFVLSRISVMHGDRDAAAPRDADFAWRRSVSLRLEPNPDLKPGVRRGLELDFQMSGGSTQMRVRVCFAFYVERRLNLDLGPDEGDAGRRQLVLTNPDEVKRARERSETLSRAALKQAGLG